MVKSTDLYFQYYFVGYSSLPCVPLYIEYVVPRTYYLVYFVPCVLRKLCTLYIVPCVPCILVTLCLLYLLPSRVSEYMTEIVDYTQKTIERGYAYESDGSVCSLPPSPTSPQVYFDVGEFDSAPCHHYAKLVPEAVGDLKVENMGT